MVYCWMLVAHTCNPGYSGGRQCGSKPAQANSSQDPISKKTPSQKRAGAAAQDAGSEFKTPSRQKKNSCLQKNPTSANEKKQGKT
jgi:hypothetical protein